MCSDVPIVLTTVSIGARAVVHVLRIPFLGSVCSTPQAPFTVPCVLVKKWRFQGCLLQCLQFLQSLLRFNLHFLLVQRAPLPILRTRRLEALLGLVVQVLDQLVVVCGGEEQLVLGQPLLRAAVSNENRIFLLPRCGRRTIRIAVESDAFSAIDASQGSPALYLPELVVFEGGLPLHLRLLNTVLQCLDAVRVAQEGLGQVSVAVKDLRELLGLLAIANEVLIDFPHVQARASFIHLRASVANVFLFVRVGSTSVSMRQLLPVGQHVTLGVRERIKHVSLVNAMTGTLDCVSC